MKQIKILLPILLFCVVISCKNKVHNLKIERIWHSNNKYKPFILDYTFTSKEKKDSVMLSTPIHFRITNNSKNHYTYNTIWQGNYEYFVLNDKKYSDSEIFKNKKNLLPSKTDDVIYFFETPVSKKSFENDAEIKLLLNDKKLGDSIIINNITPEIEKGINKYLNKDIFIISLKNIDNEKKIGIRYCFKKNKAVIFDIDSLVKANPRYMFSCDKEFYKK